MLTVFHVTSCAADTRALVYRTRGVWQLSTADNVLSSVQTITENRFDLLLFDIGLTGCNAENLLFSLTSLPYCPPVFILSREYSFPFVMLSQNAGVCGYFHLPCDISHMVNSINGVLHNAGLKATYEAGEGSEGAEGAGANADRLCAELIGRSPVIQSLRQDILRLRESDAPVLIYGESGTGKDVTARLLHKHSPASRGPFEVLNMGCIPEGLAESLLFGTVKGAFTSAVDSSGAIEQASGGTLFLDEVAEMNCLVQAKLLRVLEDHVVTRLGASQSRVVGFRLVCATNRDLEAMAGLKEFRRDLLYRIDVLRLRLPPLREHVEDIPLLAKRILSGGCKILSAGSLDKLYAHAWPGNVRELFSCLKRAVALSTGTVIHPGQIQF